MHTYKTKQSSVLRYPVFLDSIARAINSVKSGLHSSFTHKACLKSINFFKIYIDSQFSARQNVTKKKEKERMEEACAIGHCLSVECVGGTSLALALYTHTVGPPSAHHRKVGRITRLEHSNIKSTNLHKLPTEMRENDCRDSKGPRTCGSKD